MPSPAMKEHACRVSGARVVPSGAMASDRTILDLRGLRCPQPVLRAKKALRAIPTGGTLVLECTDPLTVIDVAHFCNQTGHALSAQDQKKEQKGTLYIFTIVKR